MSGLECGTSRVVVNLHLYYSVYLGRLILAAHGRKATIKTPPRKADMEDNNELSNNKEHARLVRSNVSMDNDEIFKDQVVVALAAHRPS